MSDISRTEQSDVWHVQIANGEVREGTLDELDAAFQSGAISADTMVLGPGETAWARLGDVAGLDEPADATGGNTQAAPSAPVSSAPYAASIAPPSSFHSSGVNSVMPVVTTSLDLDFNPPKFQRSKSRGVVYAIMALVVVGGGIAAFTSTTSTAAPAAAAAGVEATPKPAAPAPPPPPPQVAPPPPPAPAAAPVRLTEAQLKALADADKGRDAKRKSKVVAPSSGSRSSRKSEPSPFHNGGNPHNPLNGAL